MKFYLAAAALPAALLLPWPEAAAAGAPPRLDDPKLSHRSAFRQAALTSLDQLLQDWRLSNETMRALGGHAGHLRARPNSDAPGAARPATAAPAKP